MEAAVKRDATTLQAKCNPPFAMLKMDEQALFSSPFLYHIPPPPPLPTPLHHHL
jgi:hypothetical protein